MKIRTINCNSLEIEIDVGQIFELNGENEICVEDNADIDEYKICSIGNTGKLCKYFRCEGELRADGNYVHFEKLEVCKRCNSVAMDKDGKCFCEKGKGSVEVDGMHSCEDWEMMEE